MVEVTWTNEALSHLASIYDIIAADDPAAAARMLVRLRRAGDSLDVFPRRGRPASNGTRELVTVPPYVIRYIVECDKVTIRSVRHGRQHPSNR